MKIYGALARVNLFGTNTVKGFHSVLNNFNLMKERSPITKLLINQNLQNLFHYCNHHILNSDLLNDYEVEIEKLILKHYLELCSN